jgi:hypothetical protein
MGKDCKKQVNIYNKKELFKKGFGESYLNTNFIFIENKSKISNTHHSSSVYLLKD